MAQTSSPSGSQGAKTAATADIPMRLELPGGIRAAVKSLDPAAPPQIVLQAPPGLGVQGALALPEMRRWRGQLLKRWVDAGGDRGLLVDEARALLAAVEAETTPAKPVTAAAEPAPGHLPPVPAKPKAAAKAGAVKAPASSKPERLRPPKKK